MERNAREEVSAQQIPRHMGQVDCGVMYSGEAPTPTQVADTTLGFGSMEHSPSVGDNSSDSL